MLKKLLKYEIPSLGRKLGPLFLAWAAASVLLGITIRLSDVRGNEDLFTILSILLYTGIITAVFVMTIVLIVQRFNQSLLGDGAYFSLVLPVRTETHIAGKLIAAIVWIVLAGLAALASGVIILLFQDGALEGLLNIENWRRFFANFSLSDIGTLIEFILMSVCSAAKSVLGIYAALTIGHQARNRVALASVGAYIGLMACEGVIGWILIKAGMFNMFTSFDHVSWITIAVSLVIGAIYFLICRYLMEKKLNLA